MYTIPFVASFSLVRQGLMQVRRRRCLCARQPDEIRVGDVARSRRPEHLIHSTAHMLSKHAAPLPPYPHTLTLKSRIFVCLICLVVCSLIFFPLVRSTNQPHHNDTRGQPEYELLPAGSCCRKTVSYGAKQSSPLE